MLCLLLLFVLLGGLSCSKEPPPTAPAGKQTSDFADLFDLFDSLQEADEDTYLILEGNQISDVSLRTIIEAGLEKQFRQPITQAEMETFVRMDISGKNIKSLVGLETATNLQEISLNFNAISDLTPLLNLPNLQTLDLQNNPLSDAALD